MPKLTERFSRAFAFAQKAHGRQVRKKTTIPYVSHPMAVASLVLEYGGSEDQAVAALLHDVVEDCRVRYATLERRFGAAVAGIVKDCTDAETFPKPPWKERKLKYLDHLRHATDRRSLLVSASDKLHNARAIIHDVKHQGRTVWSRFRGGREGTVWYYRSLAEIFQERSKGAPELRIIVVELEEAVNELARLAGTRKPRSLETRLQTRHFVRQNGS